VDTTEPADSTEAVRSSLTRPAAFGLIFDQHYEAIHRYLHRRVGTDLAHELAAETFLIAFEHRQRFVDKAEVGVLPWLYGIATNLLRHQRRTERRQLRAYARSGVDSAVAFDTDASIARADAHDRGPQMAAALGRLRPDDRDAFLLVSLAGLTQTETAAALGLPMGTVATRTRRARTQLAQTLAAHAAQVEELADA
jgi:RNA polymerase sigma factor (sigma-70 family)